MSSFFRSLLSPFKIFSSNHSVDVSRRLSEPGPFSTGANIEAQTPARRRHFWRPDSVKWSGSSTPDTIKNGKPERAAENGNDIRCIHSNYSQRSKYPHVLAGITLVYTVNGSTDLFLDKVV